ncbi:MAG: hypothetical protein KC418_17265 [Anaerolineales bacterium]|nr:hypothetical protein [Anaerolineales bacterium]MCB8951571.1 hypothetical protein [Ardenticatenales bacterium]
MDNNWKQKFLIIGALAGAFIGLATTYLLIRTAEENGGGPPRIDTKDAIKVAVATIGAVRGIASLGEGKK